MKKLICTLLSTVLITCTFGNVVSFANNDEINVSDLETVGEIGIEFISVERNLKPADSELLAAKSFEEMSEIAKRKFEADTSNYSEEKIEHVASVFAELKNAAGDNGVAVAAEADEYQIGDRELIAFFCIEDGMGVLDVYTAKEIADEAKADAESTYPSSSDAGGLRDSYRHFTWNHRMTDELSQTDALIVGCNSEWGAILENYAMNLYNDYLAEGLTVTSAAYKACLNAIYFRDELYSVCAESQSYFTAFFDNAAIRDLWINCYG